MDDLNAGEGDGVAASLTARVPARIESLIMSGEQIFGTVAALGFGLNLVKAAAFGFSPLLDQALLRTGMIIGSFTIPGAYAGRWIVRRTPIRSRTRFMEIFILCGVAYCLWKATEGFGWL